MPGCSTGRPRRSPIAYLLGYEDTAAFSRFFAKMNGESITGFRQREKRE